MAVFNEPSKWQTSLVNSGDANTIPQTTPAGSGEASFEEGFPQITQVPIGAGGQAPDRKDFNGLFKVLGDWIFFAQNGGLPTYSASFDYVVGRYVVYNNTLYKCIQANGASSTVVAPDSVSPLGSDYWKDIENQDSTSLIPNQLIVSPVPLTDANLHLLDGALLSGSGAYAEYVTMMGALHDADPTANIWTDEATWQASVTSTGSCGKFVYDSVANTLRLPKYDARYLKSTLSASDLGDLVNAKAPNITATLDTLRTGNSVGSGAITVTSQTNASYVGSTSAKLSNIDFDASRSSSVYSDSATTIDTDAVKVYYYIVLGTVSKTQIQIDIDNVLSDLNLKADKDLSNVTAPVQAFKTMATGWGVPDYSREIAITNYSAFTPDADGVIEVQVTQATSQNGWIKLGDTSTYDASKNLWQTSSNTAAIACAGQIIVSKNQTYYINLAVSAIGRLVFVPFVGA